jgi:hypothetical protein
LCPFQPRTVVVCNLLRCFFAAAVLRVEVSHHLRRFWRSAFAANLLLLLHSVMFLNPYEGNVALTPLRHPSGRRTQDIKVVEQVVQLHPHPSPSQLRRLASTEIVSRPLLCPPRRRTPVAGDAPPSQAKHIQNMNSCGTGSTVIRQSHIAFFPVVMCQHRTSGNLSSCE